MSYFRDFVVALVTSEVLTGIFDTLFSSIFFISCIIIPFVLLLIRKVFNSFGG